MKRILNGIIITALLLLMATGAHAGTLHTLLNAETATTGTAIDTNATVCADDSGDLQVVTSVAHGLSDDDSVSFAAGTGSVCTGITAANIYYVTQVDSTTAFNISATPGGDNIAYTDTGTAFTTNTSGVGEPVKLGNSFEDFTCVVTWGGTTPTNTTVIVYGSIDGTNFTQIDSTAYTASGTNFQLNDYPYSWLLGEFSAKTDGDSTTAVTLKCEPGRY